MSDRRFSDWHEGHAWPLSAAVEPQREIFTTSSHLSCYVPGVYPRGLPMAIPAEVNTN